MMTLKSPTASPEGGVSRGRSLCRLGSGVQRQEGPSPTGSGKQSTGLRVDGLVVGLVWAAEH